MSISILRGSTEQFQWGEEVNLQERKEFKRKPRTISNKYGRFVQCRDRKKLGTIEKKGQRPNHLWRNWPMKKAQGSWWRLLRRRSGSARWWMDSDCFLCSRDRHWADCVRRTDYCWPRPISDWQISIRLWDTHTHTQKKTSTRTPTRQKRDYSVS